jgi:outer membrane receptor protein involved in Fe transport
MLVCAGRALAQSSAPPQRLDSLLDELRASGIDIIYSSELVTDDLIAPADEQLTPLQRARRALATRGLGLRQLGPARYVVVRQSSTPAAASADEPLPEISVYASRYALDAALAEPRELTLSDIERLPGSQDDALRSLQSLPGVVSTASARPYIRGSLSEDVLVRYDGVTLLDPFHLKNFQSLLSAIDPAAIERIEVFSGGFPVRYGTRSGGVIDISAPSTRAGREIRANLSLISAGASTRGHADSLPLEWLAAIRRSTLDLLDPVRKGFGEPQFGDTLGRLRWSTENGAWTLGWLLLDDRLRLGTGEDETARAKYRDEYAWLARDHRFADSLAMRTSLVLTSADRRREGDLQRPGVASGNLTDARSFDGLELNSDWTWAASSRSTWHIGGGFSATHAEYRYRRQSQFAPEVAAAFGRAPSETLEFAADPEGVAYSLYASNRRQWSRFEAELGLRADAQHHEHGDNQVQLSPRLNLRFDFDDALRAYASAGRFTQARHVEEWRVEEAQQAPDAAQVSVHAILGVEYDMDAQTRLGFEAYSKRWTTVSAYFDNRLDPFALLPDLAPDRIRVAPDESEASGLEISARRNFSDRLSGWGTLAWARVADDFPGDSDVPRSWDQPLSMTAGLAWKNSRASLSAQAGWHRGWPRTRLDVASLVLSDRNAARWQDFFTLDLRGSWSWQWPSGDLSLLLDVTNATKRRNACCAILTRDPVSGLALDRGYWLPAIVNLGVSYRWSD